MKKQELRQILHEIAMQAVPSNRDVWPMLRERLTAQPQPMQRARLLPATRLAWLGFVVTILFVFSITVYAAEPWLNRLFEKDERLQHIDLNLRRSLNLSQTIENVTVTVEWAYADADRALIGYTIRSSDGKRFDPYQETLTEKGDVTLPRQGGYGITGQSDILQVNLPAGEGAYVAIFNNISASRTLIVQFKVYAQELALPSNAAPTADTTETAIVLTPVPVGRMIGPFTFDFDVPVVLSKQLR
ncbi:MAG: DUF4179 domain-containing protein [Oscillochloridaceae bacterium]|nr:DUF4179 domain-containing protein [Chloroflexaceae bacterium]MDW8389490.1 DUF4179 domain-containing protein [Oscillochloridaceae bacterium]